MLFWSVEDKGDWIFGHFGFVIGQLGLWFSAFVGFLFETIGDDWVRSTWWNLGTIGCCFVDFLRASPCSGV